MARTEPTATAADIRPTVLAPPPKASAATAGNSARGWARIIAQKSARKVIRTFGRVPGSAARRARWPGPDGGVPRGVRVGVGLRRDRLEPQQPPHGEREQGRVEGVGQPVAPGVHRHPGQQRAGGEVEVGGEHVEGVGRRQQRQVQQPRVDRRTGRADHPERRALQGHDEVEPPQRRVSQPGVGRVGDRDRPSHQPGDQRHQPPVVRVDERPAVQAHHHQRDEREQADQADRERGAAERVDLQPDRDDRQLRPDPAEGEPGEQAPVRRVDPQGGRVEQDGRLGRLRGGCGAQ